MLFAVESCPPDIRRMALPSLLFCSPSAPSISSWGGCSRPLVIFVVLSWTGSSKPMSCLDWGAQTGHSSPDTASLALDSLLQHKPMMSVLYNARCDYLTD